MFRVIFICSGLTLTLIVSGFILCLPHSQAIAANSVCQKVCAGGDQKCLDCCADNYELVKQNLYSITGGDPCANECTAERLTVDLTDSDNPLEGGAAECIAECNAFVEDLLAQILKIDCNPNEDNNESYEENDGSRYDDCVRRCNYPRNVENKFRFNLESCLELCERRYK